MSECEGYDIVNKAEKMGGKLRTRDERSELGLEKMNVNKVTSSSVSRYDPSLRFNYRDFDRGSVPKSEKSPEIGDLGRGR